MWVLWLLWAHTTSMHHVDYGHFLSSGYDVGFSMYELAVDVSLRALGAWIPGPLGLLFTCAIAWLTCVVFKCQDVISGVLLDPTSYGSFKRFSGLIKPRGCDPSWSFKIVYSFSSKSHIAIYDISICPAFWLCFLDFDLHVDGWSGVTLSWPAVGEYRWCLAMLIWNVLPACSVYSGYDYDFVIWRSSVFNCFSWIIF